MGLTFRGGEDNLDKLDELEELGGQHHDLYLDCRFGHVDDFMWLSVGGCCVGRPGPHTSCSQPLFSARASELLETPRISSPLFFLLSTTTLSLFQTPGGRGLNREHLQLAPLVEDSEVSRSLVCLARELAARFQDISRSRHSRLWYHINPSSDLSQPFWSSVVWKWPENGRARPTSAIPLSPIVLSGLPRGLTRGLGQQWWLSGKIAVRHGYTAQNRAYQRSAARCSTTLQKAAQASPHTQRGPCQSAATPLAIPPLIAPLLPGTGSRSRSTVIRRCLPAEAALPCSPLCRVRSIGSETPTGCWDRLPVAVGVGSKC
ncbi:hypothetical protein VTI74DRAFT_2759 [Chaetomium olivicolor]